MAVIKSGASTDNLTIGVTNKAARVQLYDALGNDRGAKATYRAATVNQVVAAAGTVPFLTIAGSGSKTLIIQRITISGMNLTAVAYVGIEVRKYSTASSGGTAVALVAVPLDSTSSASSATRLNVYTAAPTAGTLVGTVACQRTMGQATTAAAGGIPEVLTFDFRNVGESTGIYLRGTAQEIGVAFGAAPGSAITLSCDVEWTEE